MSYEFLALWRARFSTQIVWPEDFPSHFYFPPWFMVHRGRNFRSTIRVTAVPRIAGTWRNTVPVTLWASKFWPEPSAWILFLLLWFQQRFVNSLLSGDSNLCCYSPPDGFISLQHFRRFPRTKLPLELIQVQYFAWFARKTVSHRSLTPMICGFPRSSLNDSSIPGEAFTAKFFVTVIEVLRARTHKKWKQSANPAASSLSPGD